MQSIGLVFHFFNEELLLPWFVRQHIDLFDEVIGIDYASTDSSNSILSTLAPQWRIIDSRNHEFGAIQCDSEAVEVEQSLKTDWKVILNVTELLCWPTIRNDLENAPAEILGLLSFRMVQPKWYGYFDNRLANTSTKLPLALPYGYRDNGSFRHHRFIHKGNIQYYTGRHTTPAPFTELTDQFLCWFGWSPWNEAMIQRKLQIQTRMPESDKKAGMGFQHVKTREELLAAYDGEEVLSTNLIKDDIYRKYMDQEWIKNGLL